MKLSVEILNQLSDNYSYLIYKNDNSSSIIIDPAEAEKIINLLNKKKLNLDYILITHEAIFLLSYKTFEPIKIKSTNKIFAKNSAIIN